MYPLNLGCMPCAASISHAAWDVPAEPGVHAMHSFISCSVGYRPILVSLAGPDRIATQHEARTDSGSGATMLGQEGLSG